MSSLVVDVGENMEGHGIHDEDKRNKSYIHTLIEVCRKHTLLRSDILDTRLRSERFEHWARDASALKAVYSSRPYAIIVNIRIVRGMVIAAALVFMGYSVYVLYSLLNCRIQTFTYYKLTAMERRDNLTMPWERKRGPGVDSFGMLDLGTVGVRMCEEGESTNLTITGDNDMLLSFSTKRTSLTGWYVITAEEPGSERDDPVLFQIYGSNNLEDWTHVAAPNFMNWGSKNLYRPGMKYFLPLERGVQVVWHSEAHWPSYLTYFGVWYSYCHLWFGVLVLQHLRMSQWLHLHIFLSMLLTGGLLIIGGIGFAYLRPDQGGFEANEVHSIYWIFMGVYYGSFGILHHFLPRIPELLIVGTAIGALGSQLFWAGSTITAFISTVPFGMVGVGVFLVRYRIVHKAKKSCIHRRAIYQAEWAQLLVQSHATSALDQLNQTVLEIAETTTPGQARQLHSIVLFKNSSATSPDDTTGAVLPGDTSEVVSPGHGSSDFQHTLATGVPTASHLQQEAHQDPSSHSNHAGSLLQTGSRTGCVSLMQSMPRSTSMSISGNDRSPHGNADMPMGVMVSARRRNAPFSNGRRFSPKDMKNMSMPHPGKNIVPLLSQNMWDYSQVLKHMAIGKVVLVPDKGSPLSSLDQLYSQALIVQESFFPKVIQLAGKNRGVFPLKGSANGFGQCDKPWDAKSLARFKFGGIKSVGRCVDKADISYGGDVSFLLDVCREMIVFDRLEDITACLETLRGDTEVKIVRIRSSMCQAGGSPAVPTGFAFVSVNLQMQDEMSVNLCVNHHICELLLVLKSFFLGLDKGHSHYLWYRSCTNSYLWSSKKGNTQLADSSTSDDFDDSHFAPVPSVVNSMDLDQVQVDVTDENTLAAIPGEAEDGSSEAINSTGRYLPTSSLGRKLLVEKQQVETCWGVKVDGEMLDILELINRMAAVGYANLLDRTKDSTEWIGLETSSIYMIFYMSSPVLAATFKPLFQISFIVSGLGMALMVALNSYGQHPWIQRHYGQEFYHFQYRNILRLDGSKAFSPGVKGFTPTIRHHELGMYGGHSNALSDYSNASSYTTAGANITVSFEKSVKYYGWRLELGGSALSDTSSFAIYASKSPSQNNSLIPESNWELVGAPKWIYKPVFPWFNAQEPMLVGRVVMPQEPQIILFGPESSYTPGCEFLQFFIVGLAYITYGILGYLRAGQLARRIVQFALFICFAVTFVAGVSEIIVFHKHVHIAVRAISEIIFSVLIFLAVTFEKYFAKLILAMLLFMGIGSVYPLLVNDLSPGPSVYTFSTIVCWVQFICVGISLTVARWIHIMVSKRLSASEDLQISLRWQSEIQNDSQVELITCLEDAVKKLRQGISPELKTDMYGLMEGIRIHQMDRCWSVYEGWRGKRKDLSVINHSTPATPGKNLLFQSINLHPLPATINYKSRVQSLDQLFIQAIIANSLLLNKMKDFAEATNGYFELKGGRDVNQSLEVNSGTKFVKWNSAKLDPLLCNQIQWSPLMSHSRAIEKLVRAYHNDTSCLVDILRNSIYFENIEDMTLCIQHIADDKEIKIMKIKRGISLAELGAMPPREVLLFLRVETKAACMLGCETHICKVQLKLIKLKALEAIRSRLLKMHLHDALGAESY